MVPVEGLEPPTFASEARRSNPLSYTGKVLTDYHEMCLLEGAIGQFEGSSLSTFIM